MIPETDETKLANQCVQFAEDMKARDIKLLTLEGNSLFDIFVVVTCTSGRHLSSTSDHIYTECKKQGLLPQSADRSDTWSVLDLGRVLVHLFTEETRERFDLESLWANGGPNPDDIERTIEWETNRRLDR